MTELEQIKVWISEGLNFSEIGQKLGRTRNSIAGIVSRARQKGEMIPAKKIPRKPPRPSKIRRPYLSEKKSLPQLPAPSIAADPDNSCRAILNDGPPYIYCDLAIVKGVYCEYHYNQFHVKRSTDVRR